MAKSPLGSADSRARIYVRMLMDGRCAWRMGVGGDDTPAPTLGAACELALVSIDFAPAVIFWEGLSE